MNTTDTSKKTSPAPCANFSSFRFWPPWLTPLERDQQEVSVLLKKSRSYIVAVCKKIVSCEEDAQDLAQDAIIFTLESLSDHPEKKDYAVASTAKTAIFLCLNHRRRSSIKHETALPEFLEESSREDGINFRINEIIIEQFLMHQDDVDAQIFEFYKEGLSQKEMAIRLKMDQSTVSKRFGRLKKALKELLVAES